jgi:hypothetical protein
MVAVFTRLHLKHRSPNDLSVGDAGYQGRARLYGGGGGVSVSLNKTAHLVFRVNQWKGSARNGDSHLSGYNLKASLSLRL